MLMGITASPNPSDGCFQMRERKCRLDKLTALSCSLVYSAGLPVLVLDHHYGS